MKTPNVFPDVSGHHLVYGELADFLTGETLKDTDEERVRQRIFRVLVEEPGYRAHSPNFSKHFSPKNST